MSRRILLTTIGSLGDLNPYLAVGRALRERGASVVLATSESYRAAVNDAGLDFHPLSPDVGDWIDQLPRFMDRNHGSVRILLEVCLPFLEAQFEETRAAARGADLLVSHMLSFATPMVAELEGMPWANTVLAPCSLFSVHDPSVPPGMNWVRALRPLGPGVQRALLGLMRGFSAPLIEPIQALRERHGLPRAGHPLIEGQVSPIRQLAMFSTRFAAPQPDWAPQTLATGFPFREAPGRTPLPESLESFLHAGDPPIVFTLGSAAVHAAGDFFDVSAAAARQIGRRAVLLVGRDTGWAPRTALPDTVHVAEFASYATLFPRAAAIVHQVGIGTTAEALRSGRPMLVVPWSHDQFDNAVRVERLGVGRELDRGAYRVDAAARTLDTLLHDPAIAAQASRMGAAIGAEHGAERAADALLEVLAGARTSAAPRSDKALPIET